MRRFSIAFVTTALLSLALSCFPVQAGTTIVRSIDTRHSRATFDVAHVYVTHVVGTVPILAASVVLPPGSTIPVSVSATLDAKHVDTANGDRDDDLQGPDWFDTKLFPTWSYASTSVEPAPAGGFVVVGTLTVHGVSQPLTLNVTETRSLPNPAYHAVGHIDRHGFGMRLTPTDGLIGSDVTLTLDVQLL